jgi:hypothetical protein
MKCPWNYYSSKVKSGHDIFNSGENLIRAEGTTRAEAWGWAVEQARTLGMLDRG